MAAEQLAMENAPVMRLVPGRSEVITDGSMRDPAAAEAAGADFMRALGVDPDNQTGPIFPVRRIVSRLPTPSC